MYVVYIYIQMQRVCDCVTYLSRGADKKKKIFILQKNNLPSAPVADDVLHVGAYPRTRTRLGGRTDPPNS